MSQGAVRLATEVLSAPRLDVFVATLRKLARARGAEAASVRIGYHWTKEANYEPILRDGFAPSRKGAFGPGIYISPDIDYAAHVVHDLVHFRTEDFRQGASAVFLVLVAPGKEQS